MSQDRELSNLESIKYIIKGFMKDYLSECYYYNFNHDETTQIIEVQIQKEENDEKFVFLRLGVSNQNQEIYIYNIWLPIEDRGKNLGLGAMNVLYQVSKMMNYALVLHSMVDSFYEAMLKRGAKQTLQPDCLQITDETDMGELKLNL